jgi:hypothetical protein
VSALSLVLTIMAASVLFVGQFAQTRKMRSSYYPDDACPGSNLPLAMAGALTEGRQVDER